MPDIVTSKTFVDGEKGITAAKLNQIISGAVIQPAFYSAKPSSPTLDPSDVLLELKGTGAYAQITGSQIASSVAGLLPLADTTQNGMLRKVSGLTTDFVDGTNNCRDLASSPAMTAMRQRSFNAIGNPNFECDQINIGNSVAFPAGTFSAKICDRWSLLKAGATAALGAQRVTQAQIAGNPPIVVPGTTFRISSNAVGVNLTTGQTSLLPGDYLILRSTLEGSRLRELIGDVHSLSLLVSSSNLPAGFQFGVSLKDSASTQSLTKLCTLTAPNAWQLITLPNLPIWPSGGAFSLLPGTVGYFLDITLACGATLMTPANDVWRAGNFSGAIGQGNFFNQAINTNFYIALVQHEPGAFCTTPIDLNFAENYDACLRYYQKSYDYPIAIGATGNVATYAGGIVPPSNLNTVIGLPFFNKPMAKTPTIVAYNPSTGVANSAYDLTNSANRVVGSVVGGTKGLSQITLAANSTASAWIIAHYTADTGW